MDKHRYIIPFLFLIVLFGWVGCDKSGVNCITNNGKTVKQERILKDFDEY